MMTVVRTIIEVPDADIELLDQVGSNEQCSRAALIREAISELLRQKCLPSSEAAFGIWRGRQQNGVDYQRNLRSEWGS